MFSAFKNIQLNCFVCYILFLVGMITIWIAVSALLRLLSVASSGDVNWRRDQASIEIGNNIVKCIYCIR